VRDVSGYSRLPISEYVLADENTALAEFEFGFAYDDVGIGTGEDGEDVSVARWYCEGLRIARTYDKGQGTEQLIEVVRE
jgi:hypothetical protein